MCSFLIAQLPQRGECFGCVLAGPKLRREDALDDSLLVDQIGRTARHEAKRSGHAITRSDRSAGIAQEEKRQSQPLCEPAMRVNRIGADADNLGTGVAEVLEAIAERAGLGRTDGRVVSGVEIQNDLGPASIIGEADRFT